MYNHFRTKEDLVYWRLAAFEDQLLAAIRDRPAGTSAVAAFRDFVTRPAGLLARDESGQLKDIQRMISASPALRAREQQIFGGYAASLAELLATETADRPGDVTPRVAADTLIGVHRRLVEYTRAQTLADVPTSTIARRLRQQASTAFRLIEGGLANYAVR